MTASTLRQFGREYAAHRAAEGRGEQDAMRLPYLRQGPLARAWNVRARSFEVLLARVMRPLATHLGRPLRILDLGAGNGWLSHRAALDGHSALAIDIRDDAIDGLGAALPVVIASGGRVQRVIASFGALPLAPGGFDLAVFNASLHYAIDLAAVLAEVAAAVRPGGTIAISDSPFYFREADGEAMVAEKRAQASSRFGARAVALMALPFIEYLTANRLAAASIGPGLRWRRRRVRYPLWYELRPLVAAVRRRRAPSRFDIWTAEVP